MFERFTDRARRVVVLAHQVGALEEAKDYVALLDENVRRLAAALKDE